MLPVLLNLENVGNKISLTQAKMKKKKKKRLFLFYFFYHILNKIRENMKSDTKERDINAW